MLNHFAVNIGEMNVQAEAKNQERVTLYDYFVIQMGFKPDPEHIDEFQQVCINSDKGKRCKFVINAAVALMDTFAHSKDDHMVSSAVSKQLDALVKAK
jgi:hypothetical protein